MESHALPPRGARRVWGRYPWFEAARVGGSGSLRGYSTGRFMGDAAVYGQTEVRVPLSRATLVVPGTVGLFGLADVGRVYLEGESSDIWHAGFGTGLWSAWLGGGKMARWRRPGLTTEDQQRVKVLERENRELRRTNEILRKASAGASFRVRRITASPVDLS